MTFSAPVTGSFEAYPSTCGAIGATVNQKGFWSVDATASSMNAKDLFRTMSVVYCPA